MSDNPNTALASSADAKEASSPDSSSFIYPKLDRSKNEFRALQLAPGGLEDDITAAIAIHHLEALPRDYDHQLHLSQLTAIHEYLSTATSTGAQAQIDELLRWERLYVELNELYLMAIVKSVLPIKLEEQLKSIISNTETLIGMRNLFIVEVKQHQIISCGHCEVDAVQALIRRLELVRPNSVQRGERRLDYRPSPEQCRTAVAIKRS
jgi:hypothetical protein